MGRLHLAALLSVATATAGFGQNPGAVPRAIPLPDTLDANFAVADTLTGSSGPEDYDFLIGSWRFTFQARLRDGGFTAPFTPAPSTSIPRRPRGRPA